MVTVQLDEITLNATRAALDERARYLEREIARRNEQLADFAVNRSPFQEEDAQRALVWNVDALLQTERAREFFAEVEP